MTTLKLLLTGASGYIGGTILASLLTEPDPWVQSFDMSALVRQESQAATLQNMGVKPVMFKDFDDSEHLNSIAEGFDVIVHVASGWHTSSAVALIQGLGMRKRKYGTKVHYLHVSGTSNLCDRPLTAGYVETRTFSDEEDIYSYEKYRESFETYQQRATDITVVDTGEKLGVDTYIVMAPIIFGLGTGPFNRFTFAVPPKVAAAVKDGGFFILSDGLNTWSHVHVQDLADLYMIFLQRIQQGDETMLVGRKGIYFCESGQATHRKRSEQMAKAAKDLGIVNTDHVGSLALEEAAERWMHGLIPLTETAYGANARCKAVLARKLGWTPRRGAEFDTSIHREFQEYMKTPAFAKLIGQT